MSGISTVIKEALESSFGLFLPCEDIMRKRWSAAQKRALLETQPRWHPDLKMSASRTVRAKLLLFISHAVYGTFLKDLELIETVCKAVKKNWHKSRYTVKSK